MVQIEWTSVILGLLTLLGGCGWGVNRRKYHMDVAKEYVEEFRKNIGEPLQQEVGELRKEVKELRDAIEGIYDCPYRDGCPVRDRMRNNAENR